jgi:hypothetical protein
MISTLYMITDTELDSYVIQTDNLSAEDSYATTPMVAMRPLYHPPDEEELYTSFEEAISDRLVAVQERLSRISDSALITQELQGDTYPFQNPRTEMLPPAYTQMPLIITRGKLLSSLLDAGWQRIAIFASLALMCILIGFDLMGLLVLHMH